MTTPASVFVLPGHTIGKLGSEEVILLDPGQGAPNYSTTGDLEAWQENIGQFCIGNSRLAFAVSVVLAAPLLALTGGEGAGFHIVGQSSVGKTAINHAAASVSGHPLDIIKPCDNTANAFESTAAQHNDCALLLDELGEAHPEQLGQIVYKLSGGMGRGRADHHGNARARAQWRIIFLTNGETDLTTMMTAAGRRTFAGQELRHADIEADAGADMGVFESLTPNAGDAHRNLQLTFTTPAQLADHLKASAAKCHGTVFQAYMQRLVAEMNHPTQRADRLAWIAEVQSYFMSLALPPGASGQVHRVAKRFALVAAGGELASHYGLTSWPIGEATRAATKCFNSWLSRRGTAGLGEVSQLLAQVNGFFEAFGESRFQSMDAKTRQQIPNRVGFRRAVSQGFDLDDSRNEYFVTAEQFKKELVAGFEPRWAARVLIEHGLLQPGPEGQSSRTHRLPGLGSVRAYHFPANFDDENKS